MIKDLVVRVANKLGYRIEKDSARELEEFIIDSKFKTIYNLCSPFTMTSIERMFSLYKAVRYVIDSDLGGDFVECGVWKGGSSMLVAKTFLDNKVTNRKMFLYDTYEGMSLPTDKDVSINGIEAIRDWGKVKKEDKLFCYSSLEEVELNLNSIGFPSSLINFVKGKVEDTIPSTIPDQISILRLDTDWFESTYHEMQHLYPRLVKGGVLIIDDYGHWQGAKEAIDKYFKENGISPLLNRIDYTGRIMIKV